MTCDGGGGGSELDDVATSPHGGGGTQTFPDTPCGRMQKKSNGTAFKEKFKDLNKSTNFNKRFETGYYEKADGSFNFMTGLDISKKRTLNFPLGLTSFMHIHMNNVQVEDEDGNPYTEYSTKMLSPADVGALISAAGNSIAGGLSPYDAYGVMLSSEGVFSIGLTDTDVAMLSTLKKLMDKEYTDNVKEIFKNTSANSLQRKKDLQIMLLKLLKKNGFGDKVVLFEAEVITEPGQVLPTINWIKKTLNTDGMLIEEPC